MFKYRYIGILILSSILLFSCKKEEQKYFNDIRTGVTTDSYYYNLQDTIWGDKTYDLDRDGINDIIFDPNQHSFCGGEQTETKVTLYTFPHVEIFADQSNDSVITPQVLNADYIIDDSNDWLFNSEFIIHESYPVGPECMPDYYYSFNPWLYRNDRYMGFRIKKENRIFYGWIKFEVQGWVPPKNTIAVLLKEYAYR